MVKRILFPIVALVLFGSCTTDYYYAGTFLGKFDRGKDNATEKIYVALPQEVIHTNSSLNDIAGFMFMSEYEQDSVIASKTAILDKVDDSIFLSQFSTYFLYTLSKSNIPIVVVDNYTKLPAADDQHFVVDLAQLELEEYLEPQRSDFTTRKGYYYSYDYDLRHLAVNLWLRFDVADSAEVFFINDYADETFQGTVVSIGEGQAKLKTDFERINVNDAYQLARRLGYQSAVLYVERVITDHVRRMKGENNYYFIYNPAYNTLDDVVTYDEGMKSQFMPVK